MTFIARYYEEYEVPIYEQIDAIYVIDSGVIFNNKRKNRLIAYDKYEKAFGFFLYILISDIPPEMNISTPVLERYLSKYNFGDCFKYQLNSKR